MIQVAGGLYNIAERFNIEKINVNFVPSTLYNKQVLPYVYNKENVRKNYITKNNEKMAN